MSEAIETARTFLRPSKKLPTVWCGGCGLGIVMRSSSDWVQVPDGSWVRTPVQQTRGLNRNHLRLAGIVALNTLSMTVVLVTAEAGAGR